MPSNDNNPRLFVKSYFAASVEEAMERAKAELGPDPLLLNLREAPPEARHLGECEVVFGIQASEMREAAAPPAPAPAAVPDPVADLRKRMDELQKLVIKMSSAAAEREPQASASIAEELANAGIPRPMATEIDAAVQQRLRGKAVVQIGRAKAGSGWSPEVMVRETLAELESRIAVTPEIGRITALVGPPGAGKTSTLVKLAVTYGLLADRPVRLISTDHYRIAAADQLRTYAAILGVPFNLVETATGLAQAIDSTPPDTLVLIDTPGYSAAALEESGADFASLLARRQDIDTHLVLTASMRPADLERTVDRYQCFRPKKLLFTRLDETDSTSAMFCEAARTGLPLSFFSTGQVVPEDLETATKDRITADLVKQLPMALEAVA